MFSEKDIHEALEMVRPLRLPESFGLDEYDNTDTVCDLIYEQLNGHIEGGFELNCGASKLVIVPADYSFVIKIPFNGFFVEYYNDDTEEYDEVFTKFEGACDDMPDDYCYDECNKINIIEEHGFGDLVPEMRYLTEIDGFSIYLQEKVKTYDSITTTDAAQAKAQEEDKEYHYGPLEWRALSLEYYGQAFWERFIDWCKEYFGDSEYHTCELLSDLHSGNVGVRYDGRPVIFDVSGFRDCD